VAQLLVAVDHVLVAPADARAGDVPLVHQLGDELVRGALGDADRFRDLAQARGRVLVDVDEHHENQFKKSGRIADDGPVATFPRNGSEPSV
jgi:hypothetical protein